MASYVIDDGVTRHEYSDHSPHKLLQRVRSLEQQLKAANEKLLKVNAAAESDPPLPPPGYDSSRYSTRYIALKFAYLGQKYNGFEHHRNNKTPTPPIEEMLWNALIQARLIWPANGNIYEVDWTGMDYSKCGRTDKGVSAFGQVIGIRVRSNRPLPDRPTTPMQVDGEPAAGAVDPDITTNTNQDDIVLDMPATGSPELDEEAPVAEFDDIRDELQYVSILNRLLPPEIRMLAWCPSPPENFSARFSCRERRYRYFFTQPAFNPIPGEPGLRLSTSKDGQGHQRRIGWLDIEAMRVAAKKYEGLHDFRNFCKIDASKQIENFKRRMFVSEIREVDPVAEPAAYVAGKGFAEIDSFNTIDAQSDDSQMAKAPPKVYQFVLHGSAFLWHQVRHMVAILFLVGQGLEPPSVVDELLDVERNPCKPAYDMADDAPLVLWDCIFPGTDADADASEAGPHADALPWIWIGDRANGLRGADKFGRGAVVDELWRLWRKHKMDEILAGSLLNLAVNAGAENAGSIATQNDSQMPKEGARVSQIVYQGGVTARPKGKYVPVMKLRRAEPPEVVNEKYRRKKGFTKVVSPGDGDE